MQAGYMDKVQKYTDKALMQIEKLKSRYKKFRQWEILKYYLVNIYSRKTNFSYDNHWSAGWNIFGSIYWFKP